MSETRTPRPAIPLAATAQTVARNVHRLRKARGLTVYALAQALRDVGRSISADAVCKIENAARSDAKHVRRVDVDDLMALAVVLGVSPSALLLPLVDDPATTVEITGAGTVSANEAWDWMDGRRRLDRPCADLNTAALEFALHSRPPIRRSREIGGS